MEKTRLERIVEEAVRPLFGALGILRQEIRESMNIPNSPWKILNKSYDALSDQEIMALFDIYHTPNETEACPMCKWMSQMEAVKMNQEKKGQIPKLEAPVSQQISQQITEVV